MLICVECNGKIDKDGEVAVVHARSRKERIVEYYHWKHRPAGDHLRRRCSDILKSLEAKAEPEGYCTGKKAAPHGKLGKGNWKKRVRRARL